MLEGMRLDLVILAVGWLAGWWLLWRVPLLGDGMASDTHADGGDGSRGTARVASGVAVVVPARDEEATLPALLASLAAQRVRPERIVVVDDHSTDRTAAVARSSPGVEVVAARPLPAGWTGKAWACQQGADAAPEATTLVFLDADVTLAPDGIGAVLDAHDRHGGLVSVQPHHRVVRPVEHLSAVFNLVGVMGVGMASPRPARGAAPAFGPCLVTSADDYRAVGGHAAVRGEIIEDVALGQRYQDAGLDVRAFGGGSLVAFRMYPDGLHQLVEGWSKNFASGAGATPWARLALVVVWIAAVLTSVQLAASAALGGDGLGVALAAVAVVAAQQWWMLRQVGTFDWRTALAYPLTVGAFVAVFARSVWLSVVRHEVSWRGRPIPLDHDRRWVPLPTDPGGGP